jgi:hypothetical protein
MPLKRLWRGPAVDGFVKSFVAEGYFCSIYDLACIQSFAIPRPA